jgi:hypothetical protein
LEGQKVDIALENTYPWEESGALSLP